ncbi:DNA-binding anti-repressor SinI [bacterium LRH843]|nr:DNA-binding anti-repressor SinI [bacterium LRH843]
MELDGEWVALIIEAKNMGMKLEDVMEFFENRIKNDSTNIHSLNEVNLD